MIRHLMPAVLALPLLAASPASDPVGTWKLNCVSPDGKDRTCQVKVVREGNALKGTYTADGETRPAKDVAFSNGVLSIAVDGHFAGQSYGLTYKGKPSGDSLQGTVRWSYGIATGSFVFEGERVGVASR